MLSLSNGQLVPGDWRATAYGANRRAHLFVWDMATKRPACGARIDKAKTAPAKKRALADLCRDCLVRGAAGR